MWIVVVVSVIITVTTMMIIQAIKYSDLSGYQFTTRIQHAKTWIEFHSSNGLKL